MASSSDGAIFMSGASRRARQRGAGSESFAVAARIAFVSNGLIPGWRARIRVAIPAMCGAAKLFPVTVERPPRQATSTSSPYAPNSTGGAGL